MSNATACIVPHPQKPELLPFLPSDALRRRGKKRIVSFFRFHVTENEQDTTVFDIIYGLGASRAESLHDRAFHGLYPAWFRSDGVQRLLPLLTIVSTIRCAAMLFLLPEFGHDIRTLTATTDPFMTL